MEMKALTTILCILLVISGFIGFRYFDDYRNLAEEYSTLRSDYEELYEKHVRLEDSLEALENELRIAEAELRKLMEGDRYRLHDPTYLEVVRFIREDNTDEHEYVEENYVCTDFVADFKRNAMERGIRCIAVSLKFPETGHMIVAFETIDKGLVYVEPQHDIIIEELEIGQEYWNVLNRYSPPGLIFREPEFDDTIQRIVLIW
jgi:hypothetical protein